MDPLQFQKHVGYVAILYIVLGVIGILAAIGVFVIGAGAGLASGDPDAAIAGGTCGTIIAGIIAVLSIPSLIAGFGLQKRRSWARILTIILSVINLFSVPVGTIIGGYALWVLLNDQAKTHFA